MRIEYKHAFALILVGFMIMAPAVTAGSLNSEYITAQQDLEIEDLLNNILENGAELVFANINDLGEPAVIYGQLGIPSDSLALTDEMYDGCIAMVMVATYGEMMEYILELIGEMSGSEEEGEFSLLQDDGFDVDSLLEYIGTEFSLLANVFVDLTSEASQAQMNEIRTHLQDTFHFSFQDLFSLRIDDETFPPEVTADLPFESLDIFLYNILNADTISLVFDVMDSSGFATAIDQDIFIEEAAAAAGLIAIPDMNALVDLIGGFSEEEENFALASDIVISQFENLSLSGPLALAAVGYIGEQVVSNEDTSLDVFGDLLGSTGTVAPLSTGLSLVIANLPYNMEVTSYTPENEAQNLTHHESDGANIIYWNSTGLGIVNDYTINFNADDLPPMVKIIREFSPTTVTVGESVQVTVTVANMGSDAIANVSVSDLGFTTLYPNVTVTGDTTGAWLSVAGGENQTISYTATFENEGVYAFPGAELVYSFSGNDFMKDTPDVGFEVSADLGGLLYQSIIDGMPYTGLVVGLVVIGGVWQIVVLARGKGSSDFYQM